MSSSRTAQDNIPRHILWVFSYFMDPAVPVRAKQVPAPLWRHTLSEPAVLVTQPGWKRFHVGTTEVSKPVAFCFFERKAVSLLAWVQSDSLSCGSSWTWLGGSRSSPGIPGEQLLKSSAGSWEQMNWHSKAFSSKAQVASPNGNEVSLLIWLVFYYFEHIPHSDLFPSVPCGVDTFLLLCCPYKTFHWSLILCSAQMLC